MLNPTERDLRVWWVPQVPMEAFHVPVQTIPEAVLVLKTLGRYDIFQYETHVKPDFSNSGGLEVFEDGEWVEWYDNDGNDISWWERRQN